MKRSITVVAAAMIFSSVAQAQPESGWTFANLTIWNFLETKHIGMSTIKRDHYGVFASRDECDVARVKKMAELDQNNLRTPHLAPDAKERTTTVSHGAQTVTTTEKGGSRETMFVTHCVFEKFVPGTGTGPAVTSSLEH